MIDAGIPWAILLPVTGGAGVLAFQYANWSRTMTRVWAVASIVLSLAAFTLLSEPADDVAWTRAILTVVCIAAAISTLSSERPGGVSKSVNPFPDSTGQAIALVLFSLAAFAVTCQTNSLSGLLAAHAAFYFAALSAVRLVSGVAVCTSRRAEEKGQTSAVWLLILSITFLAAGTGFLSALGGTDELTEIQRSLRNSYQPAREETIVGTASILGTVSFVLVLAAAAIPFGAFPFHFSQADVFEKQPAWLVIWMAIAGRAQAFVLLWRVSVTTMPGFGPSLQTPLLVLAAASALFGACLACRSLSLRELAANCWLVHGGLLLHCVATGAGQVSMVRDDPRWQLPASLETGLLVFVCSSAALVVLLLIEASLALPDRRLEFDEDLAGLARQRPSTGGALATSLLAFCAVPPLTSFWGVVYLTAGAFVPQSEASDSDILVPSVTVLLTAGVLVISLLILAARIVRLLSLMFFDEPLRRHKPASGPALLIAGILAAALLFGGLLPGSLLRAIHSAVQ